LAALVLDVQAGCERKERVMKNTSSIGQGLRTLALAALAMAGVAAPAWPARADVCFGGGSHPNEPEDAGGGDGSTMGLLHRPGTRRAAGTGLVLVAGLGGAWLGSRRKRGGGGDDGGTAIK
jgi:hypothetical protein